MLLLALSLIGPSGEAQVWRKSALKRVAVPRLTIIIIIVSKRHAIHLQPLLLQTLSIIDSAKSNNI